VRRKAAAVGFVLVVATAGCGGGTTPAPSPTSAPGPAEAYLDAALGVTRESAAEASLRMEEMIASCMSKQGFDYVPDASSYHVIDTADWDPPPGTRAFAEQYGYGYAAEPDGARSVSTAGPNANEAMVAAMSPQEQEEYERALWGAASDPAGDDGASGEPTLGGCFGAARDEVWGNRAEDHVRADLEDAIARIDDEAAPVDPAVLESASRWSTCMAEAGHAGYAAPGDAEKDAWDAWTAFNDAIAADPSRGEVGPDGKAAGEAEIAAQEAALATADWDCRADAGYVAVWRAARDRLQQEYVDAHRAELDAWVASFDRSPAG